MVSVLGIGNALVDVLIRLDSDDVLKKYHLGKGSMKYCPKLRRHTLHKEVKA